MVMVTTRDLRIASIVGTMKAISLEGLEDDDYWELFKKCAFGFLDPEEHPELETIGRKIAGKLKGSPLAAKKIGSLLRTNVNKGFWRTTMESEVWELPQDDNGVLSVLRRSYRVELAACDPCTGAPGRDMRPGVGQPTQPGRGRTGTEASDRIGTPKLSMLARE
ncbi:hypothetical protein OPV22_005687 [Ensete ventricosum]|uniref:NB-ARC domain-containing protein n=1 Tax=Ensete ventricosum TaxID=4639 RepID=A0AAV8RRF4_ENSVE|nr:hypothetical protein OPV22_005685 [Ensete ventricosum]KAJ8504801.1 hypothetical protein OPV22_005687 [Ensete ventricosum]